MPVSVLRRVKRFRARRAVQRKRRGFGAFKKAGQITKTVIRAPKFIELKRSYQQALGQDLGTAADSGRLTKIILPFIQQGNRVYDREGNRIKIYKITFRIIFSNKPSSSNFVRVALLRENYLNSIFTGVPNDANLAGSLILLDGLGVNTSISLQGNGPQSLVMPWDLKKVRVLYNKVINCGALGTDTSVKMLFKSISINRSHYFFDGVNTSDTSARYYLIVYMCDRLASEVGATEQMKVSVYTTLFFTG